MRFSGFPGCCRSSCPRPTKRPQDGARPISRIALRQILPEELDDVVAFGKTCEGFETNLEGQVIARFEDETRAEGNVLALFDASYSGGREPPRDVFD
jgi:hypothetical protein